MGQLPNCAGSHRDPGNERASVGVAIHPLVEPFDVECAGGGRHTGENRKGNQGGYDGLHGSMLQTMRATQLSPVIDEREHCRLPVDRLSPAGQGSEEAEFPTAQEHAVARLRQARRPPLGGPATGAIA